MAGQPGPDVTLPDPREAPRYPCEVQTTCQPPSAWRKDPWPAVIRGISNAGLSLRLARRFERGSGLAIDLPAEDGGTNTVLARVADIEACGAGGWVLGCRFISELSDEEVRAVLHLDPLRRAGLDEPGSAGRAGAPCVTGVLFQARLRGEVVRWYVKRLDLPGTWPLPAGKVLSFRVGGPDETAAVEMTIKKCRRIGRYWIIDCKFRQDLPEGVLLAITTPAVA